MITNIYITYTIIVSENISLMKQIVILKKNSNQIGQ